MMQLEDIIKLLQNVKFNDNKEIINLMSKDINGYTLVKPITLNHLFRCLDNHTFIIKPEYNVVPYTFDDGDSILWKKVRFQGNSKEYIIHKYSYNGVYLIGMNEITPIFRGYKTASEQLEYLDGSPFGYYVLDEEV